MRAMENIAWVRDATVADVAFFVGSDAAMALETEHKTLDRAGLECGVRVVFEQCARGFYPAAERAAVVAGHARAGGGGS